MPADRPKDSLRERISSDRRSLPAERWAADDAARTAAVMGALGRGVRAVAAYASVPGEPGTRALVDALVASGRRVLLPVLRREPDWAWFEDWTAMRPAWRGIPHPVGPRLGAAAIAGVDLALVPCLAVATDGSRLGTGGGWYDRVLPHRGPSAPVWALARTAEVLRDLPVEPHDVPVDAVVTEDGVTPLRRR